MSLHPKPTSLGCLHFVAALPFVLGTLWLVGLFFNPPTILSRTYTRPEVKELVGVYKLASESASTMEALNAPANIHNAKITLNQDKSARVDALPEFDGVGKAVVCSWVGKGSWK